MAVDGALCGLEPLPPKLGLKEEVIDCFQQGGGFLGEGPPDKVPSTQLLAPLSPLRDWDPLPPPGKSSLGSLPEMLGEK